MGLVSSWHRTLGLLFLLRALPDEKTQGTGCRRRNYKRSDSVREPRANTAGRSGLHTIRKELKGILRFFFSSFPGGVLFRLEKFALRRRHGRRTIFLRGRHPHGPGLGPLVSAGLKAPIVAVLSYGVFSGVTSYKGEEESKSNKSFLAIRGYPVSNARSLSLPRITYPL